MRVVLIVAFAVWSCACSYSPVVSRMIVEEPNRLVRLDLIDQVGNTEFSHPISLTREKLDALLDDITLFPRSFAHTIFSLKQTPQKAFSQTQRSFLAQYLSHALQRATSLERVVFYLNQQRDQSIREITSGSAYVLGTELHLMFSNIRYAVSGTMQANKAMENPLLVLGEFQYDLAVGAHGTKKEQESFLRRTIQNHPQYLILSIDKIPLDGGTHLKEQVSSPDPSSSRNVSLVEKFKLLDRMKEENLITEEEYQQKRRDLLESFLTLSCSSRCRC